MLNTASFATLALSFAGTEQVPHFNRAGFRPAGKRMFATYLPTDNTANIFLSPQEQAVFCAMDPQNIFPVPNKWGEGGATTFRLDAVAMEFVTEALASAYHDVMLSGGKRKPPRNKPRS